MSLAIRHLRTTPALLLIDGDKTVPEHVLARLWSLGHAGTPPRQRAIIQGDATEPAISAASILAKTCRDRLMTSLDKRWPGYGFAVHKGYGTREHYEALRRLYSGVWMVNNGYTKEMAVDALRSGRADMVSFGRAMITTPDLPRRVRDNLPLNEPFADAPVYGGTGPHGYTDYPALP